MISNTPDLGLDPSDWDGPIDHICYMTAGSLIRIRPEEGYSFTFEFKSGAGENLRDLQTGILFTTIKIKKWYFRSKDEPAYEIKIETLSVLK